jgi:GAF domain-containing protein
MSYDEIAAQLLERTGSSRVTVRLDVPEDPCFPVAGEAVGAGVRSIRGQQIADIRDAPTFRHLDRTHELLVQEDMTKEELQGHPYLRNDFAVTAQMLAPLVRDGRMIGIISAHYVDGPRTWTDEDVAAIEEACRRTHAELELRESADP